MVTKFFLSSLTAWSRFCFGLRRPKANLGRRVRSIARRTEVMETRLLLTTTVNVNCTGGILYVALPNVPGSPENLTITGVTGDGFTLSLESGALFGTPTGTGFTGGGTSTLKWTGTGLTDFYIGGPGTSPNTP